MSSRRSSNVYTLTDRKLPAASFRHQGVLLRTDGQIGEAISCVCGVAVRTGVQQFREKLALQRLVASAGGFGQPLTQLVKRLIPLDERVRD